MAPPPLWLWAAAVSLTLLLTSLPVAASGTTGPLVPPVTAPPTEVVQPGLAMPVDPAPILIPATPPAGTVIPVPSDPGAVTGTSTPGGTVVTTPPVTLPSTAAPGTQSTTPPATGQRFPDCDAARAAGAAPMRRGTPAYQAELDADADGVACEGKGMASVPAPSGPTNPGSGSGTSGGNGTGSGGGTGTGPIQTTDGVTAAERLGWGAPARVDEFSDPALPGWNRYDGPGHAGKGVRSPAAFSVTDGVLTVRGDAAGTTGGMGWGHSAKYGRWEGRVRAPVGNPSYNALLLLWPTAGNFPVGGEIDFMEMTDPTRRSTDFFLHYGASNNQVHGTVEIDGTRWHNWAVEWTPQGVTAYVDGVRWWHTDRTDILPPGPMHLCIQLDWFPRSGATGGAQMQVDWVRYYPLR